MSNGTRLNFDQVLDASAIARVERLMKVPFHLLSSQDQDDRTVLGTQRARQWLSSNPHYAKKAAQDQALTGNPWSYWKGYWFSGVNSLKPPPPLPVDETTPG